ncbi:unnamed protein product [Ascophyllum nodosum]
MRVLSMWDRAPKNRREQNCGELRRTLYYFLVQEVIFHLQWGPDPASSFMLAAPGLAATANVQHGAAVSGFTGYNSVEQRETVVDRSMLQMIRHGRRVKKLGLPADQRKALLRGLTTQIIRHGRIVTTLARAKAVRKNVDHMITLSKNGSLHARRQAMGYIYDKKLVHALFESGAERYGDRNGGYCRVLHTMPRKGDNAKMAVIELV